MTKRSLRDNVSNKEIKKKSGTYILKAVDSGNWSITRGWMEVRNGNENSEYNYVSDLFWLKGES